MAPAGWKGASATEVALQLPPPLYLNKRKPEKVHDVPREDKAGKSKQFFPRFGLPLTVTSFAGGGRAEVFRTCTIVVVLTSRLGLDSQGKRLIPECFKIQTAFISERPSLHPKGNFFSG